MTVQEILDLIPSTDRALRSVGLVRTAPVTNAVQTLGVFALGVLVGGAIALFATPVTGRQLRERVQERIQASMNGHDTDALPS